MTVRLTSCLEITMRMLGLRLLAIVSALTLVAAPRTAESQLGALRRKAEEAKRKLDEASKKSADSAKAKTDTAKAKPADSSVTATATSSPAAAAKADPKV